MTGSLKNIMKECGRQKKYKQFPRRGNMNKDKCSLLPFEAKEYMGIQAAGDRPGWNITSFDLPKAWKTTKGEGVKIYVLDTGADLDHPDLKENLIKGRNFINSRKDPWDDNMHGTHCAGTIVAPKNGVGIIGVAPKAKVAPIKVLGGNGNGSMVDVAKAIRWAVDDGADIISMSLGCPSKVQQVRKAVQYATKKHVPIFCAAGNAGLTKNVMYPARYPETIAIGSVDKNFDRSNFSNTGDNLDFMAPGGDILSCVPDDRYSILSGTSMACPFAVGVAALLLSFSKHYDNKLTLKTVEDYRVNLRRHTTPISNKEYGGKKFFQGFGLIDPNKLGEWLEKSRK